MNEGKHEQRPLLIYYFVIVVAVILLNYFVFPKLGEHSTSEVDYGTFLKMIEEGNMTEVEIQNDFIKFKTVENEEEKLYKTGTVEDPQLVERLHEAEVKFTQVVPRDYSGFFAFLFT